MQDKWQKGFELNFQKGRNTARYSFDAGRWILQIGPLTKGEYIEYIYFTFKSFIKTRAYFCYDKI